MEIFFYFILTNPDPLNEPTGQKMKMQENAILCLITWLWFVLVVGIVEKKID